MKMVRWPLALFGCLMRSRVTPLRAGLRYATAPLRRSEVLGWKGRPVSARLIEMRIKGSVRGNVKLKCEPAEWAAFCIHGPRGGQFQMGRCQDRHARLTT
jgi:hypothetical protein